MTDATLLTTMVGAACALVGVIATFGVAQVLHRRQMTAVTARLEKIDRARVQTNGMLVQAKKQIEALQKDLEESRRTRRAERAASRPAAEPTPTPKTDEVAAARAKLDLMLDAPATTFGAGGWADSMTERGFAETRPLSGFGTSIQPPQQRAA